MNNAEHILVELHFKISRLLAAIIIILTIVVIIIILLTFRGGNFFDAGNID
jgi:hypothetical protein